MDRRTWLKLGSAGLFYSTGLAALAQEEVPVPILTMHSVDANGQKIELTDFLGKTVLVSFFYGGLRAVHP